MMAQHDRTGGYAFDPDRLASEIPAEMAAAPRWLLWKSLPHRDASKKPRKVPFYADGSTRQGETDTAADWSRLATLAEVLAVAARGGYTGVGFALGPDGSGQVWQGIDFDALDQRPALAAMVERLPGYVERSPSGNGVHALGIGAPFAALGSNASGIEAYSSGRYFTVTGDALVTGPLVDLEPFVRDMLQPLHGGQSRRRDGEPGYVTESYFAKVNAKALAALDRWVPALLPKAALWRDGYRISSADLGRDLEEDLQITPEGIMDFGEERGRSPLDLVMDWGPAVDLVGAAQWLCDRLGVEPAALGYRPKRDRPPPASPDAYGIPTESAAKPGLRVVGGREADQRPRVEIESGRLPENTDDAIAHLMASDVDVFQHGSRLVRVGRWEADAGAVERPVGAGVLIDLSPEWLVDAMTRVIRFERYDKRSEKWVKTDCPTRVAKTLLSRVGEWPFAHLLGFVDSPTLDRTGRVVSAPGYDAASGLYLSNPPKMAPVPARISVEDRDLASKRLFALFETFPFASPADESALMALVLSAVLRRVLPAAPIGCISASTPGTGKSLLADCVAVLITGRRASVTALGKDGEELEKRLDSILLKGDALCCFDNVDRAVKSDVLCQVATQSHKTVRVLAQSRVVEAPTNVLLMMTGNNLTLLGDLARRSLVCTLDAGCERPELRAFERDAIEHMLTHRAAGIRWALMLAKAYLDAGCPDVGAAPYGSFEVWDRMVRRPLIWAGWPDPLGAAESMREQDQEFTGMGDFLSAWFDVFGTEPIYASDLLEKCLASRGEFGERYKPLYESAELVFGSLARVDAQGMGSRLRRWAGRIIGRKRLLRGERSKRGYPWRVELV